MVVRDENRRVDTRTFRRSYTEGIPAISRRTIGGSASRLSAGRKVISPIVGDKTGIIPTSTLATGSAFGGVNGGVGTAATPTTSAGAITIGRISSSFTNAGVGIMNTFGSIIPLAIKVIVAVIVIKIVLWLIKRR